MANFLYGSICLTDVPKELFKKVTTQNGMEKIFLNIKIVERKNPSPYGHTHFISCEPRKEERREDANYICGDLKTYVPKEDKPVTTEDIASAPPAGSDDLPF